MKGTGSLDERAGHTMKGDPWGIADILEQMILIITYSREMTSMVSSDFWYLFFRYCCNP